MLNKRLKPTSTALLVLLFFATLAQNNQLRSGGLAGRYGYHMKRIFAYLSLLFSSMLNADECSYISKDSIADDWNKATDVFLGQVISAELVGEPPFGQSLETKIRVTGVLKGNPKEEFFYKDSHSYSPSGLNVGASLIFLLYGNYKIDTCKSYLYITNGYISLNELEEHSNRADTGIANIIESILVFSEKAP